MVSRDYSSSVSDRIFYIQRLHTIRSCSTITLFDYQLYNICFCFYFIFLNTNALYAYELALTVKLIVACYINNALLPDVRAKSILLFFTNLIFINAVYSRTSFIIDSVVVCAHVLGYSQF